MQERGTGMRINNVSQQDTVVKSNYGQERAEKNDAAQEQQEKGKGVTIQASDLNLIPDSIAEKKKKAMQDAMDIVKKQFESDSVVDDTKDELRGQIAEGKERAQAASQQLGFIQEEKEKLEEEYPDQDSEEYKAFLKDLNELEAHWKKELASGKDMVSSATMAIKSINQEMLKRHDMVDATKTAEEAMRAASKEAVGMMMDEAKEKVDQDLEEVTKKAEEAKEEKEEQEEALKEAQAEQEKRMKELEEEMEKRRKTRESRAAAETMPSLESFDAAELAERQNKLLGDLNKMLDSQGLTLEEIKGIVVDMNL